MSTKTELLQKVEVMPEHLRVKLLRYAENLIEKNSQTYSIDKPKSSNLDLLISMKEIFPLPLIEDFDGSLVGLDEKYGYGSLAGKIIISDDFDEPLDDLKDYM